jgi:flagellar biosynthetic protein FliO
MSLSLAAQNVLLGLLQLDSAPVTEPTSTMPGIDMTRYALVCFGLVAVILVLAWAFKRFLAGNMTLRASQRSMKVVDVLPLGGKRQLAVVRCYDRSFLIGMGEREVSLVAELDAAEDLEGKLAQASEGESRSFKSLFQRAVHAEPAAATQPSTQETPSLGSGLLG